MAHGMYKLLLRLYVVFLGFSFIGTSFAGLLFLIGREPPVLMLVSVVLFFGLVLSGLIFGLLAKERTGMTIRNSYGPVLVEHGALIIRDSLSSTNIAVIRDVPKGLYSLVATGQDEGSGLTVTEIRFFNGEISDLVKTEEISLYSDTGDLYFLTLDEPILAERPAWLVQEEKNADKAMGSGRDIVFLIRDEAGRCLGAAIATHEIGLTASAKWGSGGKFELILRLTEDEAN